MKTFVISLFTLILLFASQLASAGMTDEERWEAANRQGASQYGHGYNKSYWDCKDASTLYGDTRSHHGRDFDSRAPGLVHCLSKDEFLQRVEILKAHGNPKGGDSANGVVMHSHNFLNHIKEYPNSKCSGAKVKFGKSEVDGIKCSYTSVLGKESEREFPTVKADVMNQFADKNIRVEGEEELQPNPTVDELQSQISQLQEQIQALQDGNNNTTASSEDGENTVASTDETEQKEQEETPDLRPDWIKALGDQVAADYAVVGKDEEVDFSQTYYDNTTGSGNSDGNTNRDPASSNNNGGAASGDGTGSSSSGS